MSEWTDKDQKQTEWIRDRARQRGVIKRAKAMLARHEEPPPPPPTTEGYYASWLFPKDRDRYHLGMAYMALRSTDRFALLADAVARGENTFTFSVADSPNHWWHLNRTFDYFHDEEAVKRACQEIDAYGLKPVPFMYTQRRTREMTLREIQLTARRHAQAWGHLVPMTWTFFEVNEDKAIPPRSTKEGFRGDDWVMAALGLIEREFPSNVLTGCHWGVDELNWPHYQSDTHPHPDTAPPERLVILYQFAAKDPRSPSDVEYMLGDWDYTVKRAHEERCVVLPWEFCQHVNMQVAPWDYRDIQSLAEGFDIISKRRNNIRGTGVGGA